MLATALLSLSVLAARQVHTPAPGAWPRVVHQAQLDVARDRVEGLLHIDRVFRGRLEEAHCELVGERLPLLRRHYLSVDEAATAVCLVAQQYLVDRPGRAAPTARSERARRLCELLERNL